MVPNASKADSTSYQPADFVILLCKSLPQHVNHIVYFDNWFNCPEPQLKLKALGVCSVGTLLENKLRG